MELASVTVTMELGWPAGLKLRGFLVSAGQTYASVVILLADNRPKRLLLQAAILDRSLLETLGNVMAVCESPVSRTRMLMREGFKNLAITHQQYQARYGTNPNPQWKKYLDACARVMPILARNRGISTRYIKNPGSMPEQWPTPWKLINGDRRRGQLPFLHGNRRAVFAKLYDSHYARQSEQAHQRAAAISIAVVVDEYAEWNPGLASSQIISDALLFLVCILSELEAKGGYPPHPKLQELWKYLSEFNDEAKQVWQLRYKRLHR